MNEIANKNEGVNKAASQYGRQLWSFIRGKVKGIEDAEDILQEVWFQLSKLSDLDELENVGAWLYAVSKNKISDFYRKNKTERIEDISFFEEGVNVGLRELLLLDESQNPELGIFKEVFWQTLMDALGELPESQRLVFIQNELEEKTLQEIADEQGTNLKTIISRKGYAIKHLRKRLSPLYEELNF